MKNVKEERFEFLLCINGNIICQRFFDIFGYNYKTLEGYELNNMVSECVSLVKGKLKEKTSDYLWRYYNPYVTQNPKDIDKRDIYEKNDTFQFEIRVDKKTIIKREFDASVYPPKIRYGVDIRDTIYDIISLIRDYLTSDEVTKEYSDSVTPLTY